MYRRNAFVGLAFGFGLLVLTCPIHGGSAWPDPKPLSREYLGATIGHVELDHSGSLFGVVVDPHGVPAPLAMVALHCLERPGQRPARAKTDPLGRFVIPQVRQGAYRVEVEGTGKVIWAWSAERAPTNTPSGLVVVIGRNCSY